MKLHNRNISQYVLCASKCFGFWHILSWKDNPTLSFWWLFNRIQAKLVIRYQLSVIGYQLLLLLQQNCSTCFYLLLSVLLLLFSIFLLLLLSLLLTTIIQLLLIMILLVIWCHLMVIWQKKIISAHYLRLFTNRFIMEYELCSFIGPALLKALLQQHSGLIWKKICSSDYLTPCRPLCVCKLAVMWKLSCLTPFSDNQGPEISCSRKAWGFWKSCGRNVSSYVHGL